MNRSTIVGGAVCLVLATIVPARPEPGGTALVGRSVLAVEGCGRDRASFATTLVIAADGTWSAEASEGERFSGTSTPAGTSGRKLAAAFDPATEAAFLTGLVSDVAERCQLGQITVSAVMKKAFTLTVNRKRTRMTLVLRYVLRGNANGRSGTARYRVKAKGPWTPATVPATSMRRAYL